MILYERFSLIVFSEVTGSREKKHLAENSIALFLCHHRWFHERTVGQSPDFPENRKRNSVNRVTKTDQRLRRNALTKL